MSGLIKRKGLDLAKYDPEKGLKTIAIAEMAERHYAKAKDASKLIAAIRAKLEAQAEFVLWWDTQAQRQHRGGDRRSDKQKDRSVLLKSGRNGIPEQKTIDRWRSKLNEPDKFEQTFTAVCARYPKLLEFETIAHVGHNSGENEWYTPREYIEAARAVLGNIDLDPASSDEANKVIQAAQIFTAEDDGLVQPWHGRVWMNPPYSQPLVTNFCEKLAAEYETGNVSAAIVLINNATETEFFQRLGRVAAAICFPNGRVRFWSPGKESATPLQGQAVLYLGAHVNGFFDGIGHRGRGFVEVFSAFGIVLVKS